MTTVVDALDQGRKAFQEHSWGQAYACLSAADQEAPLGSDDLERLAISAYLIGRDEVSVAAWSRAHYEYLRAQDIPRSARCAFWISMVLLSIGEWARAGGWHATAQRLLDAGQYDCPERGLLLVMSARRHLKEGNTSDAYDAFSQVEAIGVRFNDPELKIFGRLGQGHVQARRGETAAAAALFDEVMVTVTTSHCSPIAVGIVYCAVIEECYQILDLGRAREWTTALSEWCASQPDLVPFRGHCLVYRAETMRLSGAWSSAIEEAEQACRGMSQPAGTPTASTTADYAASRGQPVGAAFYELGEIYRMRGKFADAEEAYRQASAYGRSPEPGLALLRLAQGRVKVAEAAMRRLLDQPQTRLARARILAACVDVMIATRDLTTTRAAVEELGAMADGIAGPFIRAVSAQANGALRLASNEPRAAFDALRDSWVAWQTIEAPYDAARVRVMMALACRELGDEDAATMELDAARRVFVRLDATPDVLRVNELLASSPATDARCLTPRELEVIRLIAAGKTNRAIASALSISERTVDRHVSNILNKLDLSSRSAATAYAYEHGLV
jgi:DNA-binding CsgD family transcriptional regulator/tetratricopeptide (TPR) repeat protein